MIQSDDEVLKEMEEAKGETWEKMEGKEERLRALDKKTASAQTHIFYSLIGRLSQARIFKEIHDKKLYKARYKTFEEYCQDNFNRGRQSIYDDLKIVNALTKDFVAISDKIGFSFRTLRLMSRLSEKDFVAISDKIITIEGAPYEIIPENKKEIQEAIAELTTRLESEKRKADGFKKMADNRAAKTEKLERDLNYIKNPNPNKSEIESIIDKADTNITLGLAQLCSTVRMLMAKEKETGENAPERPLVLGLMGKTKFALMEAIETAERDLGELSELEIREGYKKMGMPLPKKNPEE